MEYKDKKGSPPAKPGGMGVFTPPPAKGKHGFGHHANQHQGVHRVSPPAFKGRKGHQLGKGKR